MSDYPKKILIAEDDMIIAMVLERIMKQRSDTVVETVVSGEAAINTAETFQPDLILMDIQLKGDIDGIQAMRKIREKSDVPVIYITGNSEQHFFERAKKTEFAEYMVKPIQIKDLQEAINKIFQ